MCLIPLYVIIPLITGITIAILGKKLKFLSALLTNLALGFLTFMIIYCILKGPAVIVYKVGGWGLVDKIPIGIFLVVDGFSKLLLVLVNFLAFCAGIYAVSYIKRYTDPEKYYALYCLLIAGMNGVIISGDLFNIFVFLEIGIIASYALVAFGIKAEELEASFKYQILSGVSSMIILLGIALAYWAYGTLNIADLGNLMRTSNLKIIYFIQALFIMGFGLKAALVPFHTWLPDAHSSAPSSISAVLSGVLIKAMGAYILMRLFFNMFPVNYKASLLITVIGALSMVIGVFLAIGQWDIKRLLAYHSISQMGYVITGVGVGLLLLAQGRDLALASLAILGGVFHLFNHALFKGLLFLTAGSVEYQTDLRDMRQIGGLSEKMPVTTFSSLSASLAISGIPPFNGFFSKLIIIIALVKAQYYILAALAVIVSIITLSSFMKVQRYTYFEKLKNDWSRIKESPFSMCFSMVILAVLCLVTSVLLIPGINERFLKPAVDALAGLSEYSKNVLGF